MNIVQWLNLLYTRTHFIWTHFIGTYFISKRKSHLYQTEYHPEKPRIINIRKSLNVAYDTKIKSIEQWVYECCGLPFTKQTSFDTFQSFQLVSGLHDEMYDLNFLPDFLSPLPFTCSTNIVHVHLSAKVTIYRKNSVEKN